MHTVLEVLKLSTEYLKQKSIDHPRRQAEELLGEALGIGRMGLYLNYNRPLNETELVKCRAWLKRRSEGEPLQYIAGIIEFFNCRFKLTHDVIIPRQETEILVDKIAKQLALVNLEEKVLWDVCCGSGCIGIALKKKFPQLKVVLSDLSPGALELARENAINNEVEVEFLEGDLLSPFSHQQAHFIICNPPYISEKDYESLEKEVKGYEPKSALVSGDSGLEFYIRLADQLASFLHRGGKAWFEIGTGQGEAIKKLFNESCWTSCFYELDWSGHDRFFSLEIE